MQRCDIKAVQRNGQAGPDHEGAAKCGLGINGIHGSSSVCHGLDNACLPAGQQLQIRVSRESEAAVSFIP